MFVCLLVVCAKNKLFTRNAMYNICASRCMPGPLLTGLAKDNNASALDAGIDALDVFVQRGRNAAAAAEEIVPLLIVSGFSSRPKTVEKTRKLLLTFMEVSIHKSRMRVLLSPRLIKLTTHTHTKSSLLSASSYLRDIRLILLAPSSKCCKQDARAASQRSPRSAC